MLFKYKYICRIYKYVCMDIFVSTMVDEKHSTFVSTKCAQKHTL